jgi:acetolactate synthase-1/3 small subunit
LQEGGLILPVWAGREKNIARITIVDFGEKSLILEISGNPIKIISFEQLLKKLGILEIAKTGKVALTRN